MKRFFAAFLIALFIHPFSAFCEIQTITHTVRQPFAGSQSPDDARIAGVAKAKREALEKAGVYVEALTVVKDAKVDKDEILAITAGIVKSEIVSQKNYALEEAFGIEVKVKVVVDSSILEGRVKKLLQDKTHLEQLNQARKREKELLATIALLEKENQQISTKAQSPNNLKKRFHEASQGLTALDWYNKAIDLAKIESTNYIDRAKKEVEYLNEAIRLDPSFAGAYNNRGTAYSRLGQHQQAIKDYNEAIRLAPDHVFTVAYYTNRGTEYSILGQHQRAIKDYNEAIRLKPNFPGAHISRGTEYSILGQYQQAIKDYNEAIRLDPSFAGAYIGRGNAYSRQGQFQQGIKDYNEAIRLAPDDADAYYNRGTAYSELEQYQQAINDYNVAIRLNPSFTGAYIGRGGAYFNTRQYQQAIKDYNEAIRLAPDDADAYYNRGVVYGQMGHYQQAIKDYDAAIRLKPDYVNAYLNRGGIAYSKLGQHKQAIKDYDAAIRLNPSFADAYYNKACIYALQKDTVQACHFLAMAIERGFNNWEHMKADKDFDNIRNEKCFIDIANSAQKQAKMTTMDMGARASVLMANEVRRDGRFIAYSDGTVLDTRTNLMWAAMDGGTNVDWASAKSYCENYRGGGYVDWRMPTIEELSGLYDTGKSRPAACKTSLQIHVATELIDVTCLYAWTLETNGSNASIVSFFKLDLPKLASKYRGYTPLWLPKSASNSGARALPVRSVK